MTPDLQGLASVLRAMAPKDRGSRAAYHAMMDIDALWQWAKANPSAVTPT